MKKLFSICLVCLAIAGLLTGCGKSLEADRDTVYVQKKGTVTSAAISDFDKDYYDEEELKKYVDERVADYQEQHGEDSVSIDKFSVEEGVAKLYINYKGYEEYQDFNEVTLFSGTVPQALAEGFDFNTEFTEIKGGEAAGTVSKDKITDTDAKVININKKVDVKVDGTILYVSGENTSVKGKDTASMAGDEERSEEADVTYIIYK